jgi:putative membrane protein
MKAWAGLAFAFAVSPAAAHGGPGAVWSAEGAWAYDPRILVPLYLSAILYLIGTKRLWRRAGHGRGVRHWQAACFWLGWTFLALALVSPLHWLGERLFTAHMIEHEIIMAVAAPLLAISRPIGAFLWAVPPGWRRALGGLAQTPAVAAVWRAVSNPLAATTLHGVALWAWHMPALYDRVLVSAGMHWFQHVSFLFTALLFWWSLVYGRARRRGYGAAVFYLFVTALHTGVLGILLTVSQSVWYPQQALLAAEWGLKPLEDQQLAGLVMWVPAGLVYAGAALALAGLWISRSGSSAFQGGVRASA